MVQQQITVRASFAPGTIITRDGQRFRAVGSSRAGTIFSAIREASFVGDRPAASFERPRVLAEARAASERQAATLRTSREFKPPQIKTVRVETPDVTQVKALFSPTLSPKVRSILAFESAGDGLEGARLQKFENLKASLAREKASLDAENKVLEKQLSSLSKEVDAFSKDQERLQRLADRGLLLPGVAKKNELKGNKLNQQVESLNKNVDKANASADAFNKGVQAINRTEQRANVSVGKKVSEIKTQPIARFEVAPTKREVREELAFPLERVIPTEAEFAKRRAETAAGFEQLITGVSADIGALPQRDFLQQLGLITPVGLFLGGFGEFFETGLRGIGAAAETGVGVVEQVTGEPFSFKATLPRETAQLITGFEDVPIIGPAFRGVGVRPVTPTATELLFGKPQVARAAVAAAELELLLGFPGTRAAVKGVKAVRKAAAIAREPSFFPTPIRRPPTQTEIDKVFLEAIIVRPSLEFPLGLKTRPLVAPKIVGVGPEFPLTFRPTEPLFPVLPVAQQKAFKITKKFIETEAKLKVGLPGQAIRSFKVKEVIPNIDRTKFVDDLAKEFGTSKKRIVNILNEERIVSATELKGIFGVELAPSKVLKGKVAFIDITKEPISATIKHELTHAVQRKLGFKGTRSQIEAQATRAEGFGGPGVIEGPVFPLGIPATRRRLDTLLTGEGPEFPLGIPPTRRIPGVPSDGVGPSFPLGLPTRQEITLDLGGLTFRRVREPKVKRFKPLEFVAKQEEGERALGIPITKQVKKVKKVKKVKEVGGFPVSTEQLELSTQAFAPTTQRFRRRFFEEVERGPLQRFVPSEARVPTKVSTFERVLGTTVVGAGTLQAKKLRDFQRDLTAQLTGIKQVPALKDVVGLKEARAQKAIEATRARTTLASLLGVSTATLTGTAQLQALRTLELVTPRTGVVSRIRPRITTVPRVPPITRPRRVPPPPPLIPLLGPPAFDDLLGRRRPTRQGFSVSVKSRGKFRKINRKPLTRSSALGLGADFVDRSTARSFFITKSKKKGKAKNILGIEGTFNPFKFRRPARRSKLPRETFIERSAFAIDTPGERQGITFKGLLALERRRAVRKILRLPTRRRKRKTKKRKR